jgi:hypothetical protein
MEITDVSSYRLGKLDAERAYLSGDRYSEAWLRDLRNATDSYTAGWMVGWDNCRMNETVR